MEKFPKVSIATPTFNGERDIEKYLKCIFSQDYPFEKLEVILNDAGSTDGTLETIRKYKKKYPGIIQLMFNSKRYTEGKGFGNDQVTRATTGDIIIIMDQDNMLIQKDWISNMVKILVENPEISGVQSRMHIPKNGTALDKYLNAVGIEDPFAIPYSLNAQIVFNPQKFKYDVRGDFYIFKANLNDFLYAGANGFVVKRKDFFEAGGYTQDTENFYKFALKGYKIAVPKNVRLHHQTSTELKHYLKKRTYFVMHYLLNNYNERYFYWFNLKKNTLRQNLKFVNTVLFNMLFFPALFQGILMALKQRRAFWLIHPFVLFSLGIGYFYSLFYTKIFKKIGIEFKH